MNSRNFKKLFIVSLVVNVLLLGVLVFGFSQEENLTVISNHGNSTPALSFPNLPPDVDSGQIVKVLNNEYALVVKSSLNYDLSSKVPKDFQANFSGVLKWDAAQNRWRKLLSITDTDKSISSNNNPVDLTWNGSQIPHLTVYDTNGAGSGEGIAKELVAQNQELTEWKVVDCFYYAPDTGKGKQYSLKTKECQAVKISPVIELPE